jgi:multiple sugar transport system substrate-binding protein
MDRRRSLSLLAVAALTVGGLTACSAGKPSDNGPVTLTLVEYQKPRADAAAKLIPAFEKAMAKEGKKVTVKLVSDILTDDQFRTKITQQYTAGTAPDVTDYGSPWVPGFAGAGYLLPLDPYLQKWSGWKTFFPDVKKQIVQPDGKTYQIPHEANAQSLFYRKDVLQKLGIDTSQPATWADLVTRMQQITAKTHQPSIVIPAGTSWGGGTFGEGFLNLMAGTGSTLYDTKAKKWVVKSPGLTETFNLYAELTRDKLLPVQALLNPEPWQPTKYKAFPAGTLPVAAQGTWGWRYDWGPSGAAPIDGLTTKVATWDYPTPQAGGQPYSVGGVAFSYEVSAKTKHPDAAVALAEWMSSGRAMAEQLVAVGAAAPRSGVSTVEPYASQSTLLDAEKKVQSSRSFPPRPGQDQIAQAVAEATEGILTGKMTGEQAAAAFAKNAADLLGPSQVAGA